MNLSKTEQRVLHALAQGAVSLHKREGRRVIAVTCVDRDGAILSDCDLAVFERLRRRRLIRSEGGAPYRIARAGRLDVRSQPDDRA